MIRRQRGVALVLILLVTAIIMLLVVQLSLTARDQVHRAQALRDRSEAALFLQSREAALLFTLLTNPLVSNPQSNNPYAARWNFHGEPFAVDGLAITLQDQSGLMRVPATFAPEFEDLLRTLGVDAPRAREIARSLAEWTGEPGPGGTVRRGAMMRGGDGGPVQYLAELRMLPGMDETLYMTLAGLMTLYPTPGFNPFNAPAPLLRTMMSDATLEAVLEARKAGDLDQDRLWRFARVAPDETVVPGTGPGIGIALRGKYQGVELRRHLVVGIHPYDERPLELWSRERFGDGYRQ